MPLVFIIVSVLLMAAYGAMFLRPRFRILSAALISASLFFLYLALANLGSEAVNRLSVIMLGVTGLGTIGLVVGHLVFERGNSGRLTGARAARPPRNPVP